MCTECDLGHLRNETERGGGLRGGDRDVDGEVGGEFVGGEELLGGCVRRMVKGEVEETGSFGGFGFLLEVLNQVDERDGVGGSFILELLVS